MNNQHSITLGQSLELDDGCYRFVAYQSGFFKLRSETTDECVLFTAIELARLSPAWSPVNVTDLSRPPVASSLAAELEALSADDLALWPHLQELVDGTPAVGSEPRPEYDPRLPMTRRRGAKLLELERLGIPMSERTLQRRVASFKEHGVAGLRDRRTSRNERAFHRVDEDVVTLLKQILAGYTGRTATSYAAIRAELAVALMDAFPDARERPTMPSVSSVARYVKMLTGDQDPTLPGAQRQTAGLRPQRTFRQRLSLAPGDECQMDTTVFDAFVRMPDGRVERPHLTTLIDARTRSVIGFNFTDGAPSGEDHAALLARTLVPQPLRPWNSLYAELDLPEMPWAPYVDGEEHRHDTHRPYIFPRRILIDNGQDYRSGTLHAACGRYGIDLTEAPPKSATTKAKVERNFGSTSTMFARHLPGYVGGDTQQKGEGSAKEDVLELRTVAELFDQWLAIVWQNRQHEGLVDPLEPSTAHTPNTMYAASLELTGHFMIPLGEDDYIELMRRTERTVQSDGIELNGRRYDSPYLAPMRLQKDANGDSVKVHVHFDKSDPSQVWVRSSDDGGWITCEWTADAGLARPNERRMLANAAALADKNKSLTNDDAHLVTVRLRQDAQATEKQRRAEEREAKKAKKKKAKSGQHADLADIQTIRPRNERLADYLNFEELGSL